MGNDIGSSIGGDFLLLLLNAMGERLAEREGGRVVPVGIMKQENE